MKKNVLFLGPKNNFKMILKNLSQSNSKMLFTVKSSKQESVKYLNQFDLLVSYGYRHKFSSFTLSKLKTKAINLHISYLPYNRGSHPNFWSFVENTPTGVSIHEISNSLDSGNIICQKLTNFELYKNRKKLTFANTYNVLNNEIEKLFLKNFKNIINNTYSTFPQIGKGSFHNSSQLPKILTSWNQNIYKTVIQFHKSKKKEIQKKLQIIDKIENTRKKNNVNWMNIVRNSLKLSPHTTLEILREINFDDIKISSLFKELVKK